MAIATVHSTGRLGPAQLVSDQRGTGRFDDRPVVTAGPDGTVWVAWSQGTDADACQNVGQDDQIEVAVSHDGGRTFGAPVALPVGAGHAAFGARLAPLAGGQVAVSWTETMSGDGDEAVFVSVLPPDGQPSLPQAVLTGNPLPLALPGASFYDFPAGDVTALPSGRLRGRRAAVALRAERHRAGRRPAGWPVAVLGRHPAGRARRSGPAVARAWCPVAGQCPPGVRRTPPVRRSSRLRLDRSRSPRPAYPIRCAGAAYRLAGRSRVLRDRRGAGGLGRAHRAAVFNGGGWRGRRRPGDSVLAGRVPSHPGSLRFTRPGPPPRLRPPERPRRATATRARRPGPGPGSPASSPALRP